MSIDGEPNGIHAGGGRPHRMRVDRVAEGVEVRAFLRAWDAVGAHGRPQVGSLYGSADERASGLLRRAEALARALGEPAPRARHVRAMVRAAARTGGVRGGA